MNPGGPCGEPTGRGHSLDLGTARDGMHVYSLQWDTAPERLSWAVDGRTFGEVGPGDLGPQAWRSVADHGYFLLLNLAMGGNWPGYPDLTTAPSSSMTVDWVRVSRRSGTSRH
jgi:beta-glucanase (GH16 family)